MKSLDDIWDEYVENDRLSIPTLKDLTWHIEHDDEPEAAIVLATDMRSNQLAPIIAQHFDHEYNGVREVTVSSLVGRLRLVEYAERAFQMAKEDTGGARDLAIFNIGAVLGQTRDPLRTNIAQYLVDLIYNEQEDNLIRHSAYAAMNDGLGVPSYEQPAVVGFSFERDVDWDLEPVHDLGSID